MPSPQARYYILTIPRTTGWTPALSGELAYLRGQEEIGEGGFQHWQVLAVFSRKVTLTRAKTHFPPESHLEPTRSAAAEVYVWKEDTRVPDTQFELGAKPFHRGSAVDWEGVWNAARVGDFESIPHQIRVQSYSSIRRIAADFARPTGMERSCHVFWGATGTGKSRRAWEEAGEQGYPKDPRSKFWCGYQGQEHVVIDEFRGGIDIGHLLRWLDRYPVIVEIKGSSVVLSAKTIWITSNLPPESWYPDVDPETMAALRRRLTVTHFP